MVIYFLRGELPWQGLPGRSKTEKYNNIKKKKKETSLDDLCTPKVCPPEFKEFMEYCRQLGFTDAPDYSYIINLFENAAKRVGADSKAPEFIWNQNRLAIEREALKQQLRKVVTKTKDKETPDDKQ